MQTDSNLPQGGDIAVSSKSTSVSVNEAPRFDQEFPHLYEETAYYLKQSPEDRVKFVHTDKFIVHENAKTVLAAMKDIYNRPPGMVRPACLGVIGASNEGKTATAKRFFRDLGGDPARFFGNHDEMPVLCVEMPPRATEPRICLSIARALGLTGYGGAKARIVTDNVYRALVIKKVRVLILMEFQHVMPLPCSERQVVFDLVKGISNHGISIIAIGTEEAKRIMGEDEQIANRMRIVRLKGFAKGQEFYNVLHSLEPYYPLPMPSGLSSPKLADEIYGRTNGITGEVVALCNAAAAYAIRHGKPCIDKAVLTSATLFPAANVEAA
jgi:hypothetical protein